MKATIVAASALVASVAASAHNNHAGFHMRRGASAPKDEVCTVYTTVYVDALPSIVPNTTAIYEHSTPAAETSTSCTEEDQTSSVYTPIVISTETPVASQPAYPTVPVTPESSKPAVPESSQPVVPEYPAEPIVPEPSKEVYPPVPVVESSKPAPEPSKPATPEYPAEPVDTPEPAPEPTEPAAPEYPAAPVDTPEPSKPAAPEYPTEPVDTPKPAPEPTEPAPEPSKPATPEYPTKPVDTPKPAPSSSKAVEKPKPKPTPSSSTAVEKPKPTGSYSSGGRIVTNGNKWAMTYTPYAPDGNCKTEADIKSDVKLIAELGFTTIRSYSTDCGVFEYVVPACQEHGLKIIYGIFLEAGGSGGKGPFSQYANDQLDAIKKNAPKDGVAMVIVGNECMFNNNCAPAELASYIDHVREQLQGAGFPQDIAITTTEPVGTWEEKGAALCDHIDVFTVQVHPYFTATISADMAGDFAAQQLEQAAKVCPEAASKGKYISEIGWPSAGNSNGLAVAGVAEQKEAMKKIMEKVGAESTVFSFKDDPWKHPGALNVEQHFGCADALP